VVSSFGQAQRRGTSTTRVKNIPVARPFRRSPPYTTALRRFLPANLPDPDVLRCEAAAFLLANPWQEISGSARRTEMALAQSSFRHCFPSILHGNFLQRHLILGCQRRREKGKKMFPGIGWPVCEVNFFPPPRRTGRKKTKLFSPLRNGKTNGKECEGGPRARPRIKNQLSMGFSRTKPNPASTLRT